MLVLRFVLFMLIKYIKEEENCFFAFCAFYAHKIHLRGRKSLVRLFESLWFLCFLCFLRFLHFLCMWNLLFLKKKRFKSALIPSFTILLILCFCQLIWTLIECIKLFQKAQDSKTFLFFVAILMFMWVTAR